MKIPNFPLVLRKRRQSDRLPWRSVARFTIALLAASLLRREALALHHPPEMTHAAPSPVSNSSPISNSSPVSKLFVPPPTRAPVGSTQGGASRSDHCQGVNGAPQLPIVLMPYGRQTIATPPTFFWFVPNNPPSRVTDTPSNLFLHLPTNPPSRILAILSTLDEAGEKITIHQDIYDIESRVGIVDFTLPSEDGVELSEQSYQWDVVIYCSQDHLSPSDPVISAIVDVEMPSPFLVTALEVVRSPQARAELYAEAGYWYDALREAMAQRHSERSIAPSHQLDNSEPVISILRYLADTEGETDQGNLFRQIADQLEQEQQLARPSCAGECGG